MRTINPVTEESIKLNIIATEGIDVLREAVLSSIIKQPTSER